MIPIKLTIQGIYSYQTKQTIDFTKLTQANIFGIFGAVGSGKSTILEAITFALYGKTDRLNLSGDNRNYNMMNLKSNELFIEFVFETGQNNNTYMLTVKGRRNSKQFNDVKTLERSAYKQVNNTWEPITTETLEQIIGLSYDNFKRAVIIPQGKFQEFLQLGNKERTQMMKELFNLEKFELYNKVISLETKNNLLLQQLNGQLQQIGDISTDQIKQLDDEICETKKIIETNTQQLKQLRITENNLLKLFELITKADSTAGKIASLKKTEPEINELSKKITEYEFCNLNFKNLINTANEKKAAINNYNNIIDAAQKQLLQSNNQIIELNNLLTPVKTDYNNREQLLQKADEIEKIEKIISLSNNIELQKQRILKGEQACTVTLKKISSLKTDNQNLLVLVKKLKDQLPNLNNLSDAKNWFTVHNSILQSINEANIELNETKNELHKIEIAKTELIKINNINIIYSNLSFTQIIEKLDNNRQELLNQIADVDSTLQNLKIQQKLQEFSANLNNGSPCPLCGSLNHPNPLNNINVNHNIVKYSKIKTDTENNIKNIENSINKLLLLNNELELKTGLFNKANQKITSLSLKLDEHNKLHKWPNYTNIKTIETDFNLVQKLQTEIKEIENKLELIAIQIDTETQNNDKYTKAVDDIKHKQTANITEHTTLINQLKLLNINSFANTPLSNIIEQKNIYIEKYNTIESKYQQLTNSITLIQKQADTITGSIEANKIILQKTIDDLKTVNNNIEQQLLKTKYNNINNVINILNQQIDIEISKKRIDNYNENLAILTEQLKNLNTEIGNQQYNNNEHQAIKIQITGLTTQIETNNQHVGKLINQLQWLKTNIENQKNLTNQIEKLTLRANDIKTLKQLFKGSGFVNYISTVYLQELCHAANQRFYKLTGQKLSLEVTADNNFQVRDYLNGGKVRNVKTLSGGQTFQAALSLALALADNVQKITKQGQNFFFLDEGFGSLDKGSLNIVFDTLKSLRKENRVVGVISHVDEMNQEIDTYLQIVNNEQNGSTITTSWQ